MDKSTQIKLKQGKETIIFDVKDRPLSYSSLKHFYESPRHYINYVNQPKVHKDEFVIGQATEALIYEELIKGFKFNKKFIVYQKFRKQSNDAKALWAKMLQDAKDNKVTLIDEEQFKEAKNCADTALQTDETRYYLDRPAKDKDGNIIYQKKLIWTDKKTGLPIVGYVDWVSDIEGHLIIIDIKTNKSGNPNQYIKDAANLEYHLQVGSYLTAYHKKYYQFPDFMFMVIDKNPPYDAVMMHCEPEYIEDSKNEFAHVLQAFRHCIDEQQFHRGRAFWSAEMGYFNMCFPGYKKLKYKI